MITGDPVRIAFFSTQTDATHTNALGLFIPGSVSTYPFGLNDMLIIDTLGGFNQNDVEIYLSILPAGTLISTAFNSSTTMMALANTVGAVSYWGDAEITECMSGIRGIIPSFGNPGLGTLGVTSVFGTGHVVHLPGYTQPWTAPGTPAL